MKRFCYLLGICALFFSQFTLHAATMHVIIAADSNQEDIGSGIRADLYLLNQELNRIARYTGLLIEKKTFADDDYHPDLIFDYLKQLIVGTDDVVLYYHSSHGFRTERMPNAWPALDFGALPAVDFSDIVTLIERKPQRFALILADCCNTCMPSWAVPPFYRHDLSAGWNLAKYRTYNYRKLFLDQRGVVIAVAAQPGQYAWINLYFGGFFTTSFLAQLKECCDQKTGDVQWSEILEQTKLATQQMCVDLEHLQDPIYEINIQPREISSSR
jgi:hypothetical protein